MLFIIYLMVFSIDIINMCYGCKEVNYQEDELSQRRMLQNERKKHLDKFQMKRKGSFVITPPFEHEVLTLGKRNSTPQHVRLVTLNDTREYFEHKAVTLDNRSKPYQHTSVPSDKSNDEERVFFMDEKDHSDARADVNYAVNDKNDQNAYDIEGNEYGNDAYDAYYYENNDDRNSPNLEDEYNAQDKLRAVMDVLSKQNVMVEKLIDLYQSEMGNKQFEKLIDSINRKQYLQFLKNRHPGNARTGDKKEDEKKHDSKEQKKAESKEKTKPHSKEEKKHDEPDTINNIIRIDETLVKQKLAKDPFVKRILGMAKRKKMQYINKKKQEMELEG